MDAGTKPIRLSMLIPVLLLGCSSAGTTGPTAPVIAQAAGAFSGSVAGKNGIPYFDGTLALNVQQHDSSLVGIYQISGVNTIGTDTIQIAVNGSISGAVGPGDDPAITLTFTQDGCSAQTFQFTGTFAHLSKVLTILGPVTAMEASTHCSKLVSFQATIHLALQP